VSKGKTVEWIRACKIPLFTDDDGDVHMFRTEFTDAEGNLQQTDMKRDYHSLHLGNTMLDAAFSIAG
jgi:hypothetical protein